MADRYEEWDRHLRQYIVWDNNESAVVSNVVVKWLELTEAEGLHTSSNSQDVQLIDGNEAWLVYIAKHGIRGVKHYQRALDNMPDEWRDGAGAMWGHDRKMPVADDSVLPMDMRAFHQFRREARKWCCAHACMIKDPHRRAKAIGQARPEQSLLPAGVVRRASGVCLDPQGRDDLHRQGTALPRIHDRLGRIPMGSGRARPAA